MRKILFPIFIAAMSFAANAKAKEITEVVDSSHVYELDEVCVVRQPKEQFLLRRQGVSSTMLSAKDMFTLHATDLRELFPTSLCLNMALAIPRLCMCVASARASILQP